MVAFSHDIIALTCCWFGAYWLRFNLELPDEYLPSAYKALILLVAVHAPIYWLMGLYRGVWRYASIMDLRRIIVAVLLASLGVAAAVSMLRITSVPRSVLVLHPMLLVLTMGGSRFVYRAWKDRALYGRVTLSGEPVLVLGTGSAAERLLRELDFSSEWYVVGMLDNEFRNKGAELRGIKILGQIKDVADWAWRLEVKKVVVAMPEATLHDRRQAMETAIQAGLSVMTVPSLEDMLSGNVAISQMRQVQLEDLLGRDPVQLDSEGIHGLLYARTVMVTGAGGSIGSELARQIAGFEPGLLVLFELSEFALYQLEQEFLARYPTIPIVCVVGDVKDRARLDQVFGQLKPSIVFHAAAYKNVPMMEGENAWEAVQNNVVGSKCIAEISVEHRVEKFVLISTDKAVNPTNVMGATKRLAERVLSGMQSLHSTQFITVRFGNVLGSNGSVIPKFREQIAKGGPLTVTHPEVIRYFMLIPEAAQLVLQSGLMGAGGEIYVLDMGDPIRILDLARDMIRLSGFSEEDVRIVFTGLRPGEKLFEELLTDNEHTLPTLHPKLRVAQSEAAPDDNWRQALDIWLGGGRPETVMALKTRLQFLVPEYSPQHRAGPGNPDTTISASLAPKRPRSGH